MIKQSDTFSHNKFFYAIDFSSIHLDDGITRVNAVWFKETKEGIRSVSQGTIWNAQNGNLNVQKFIEAFRSSYGGSTEIKWDGKKVWAPRMDYEIVNQRLALLKPMLENFPAIPDQYEGWFSIKS